MIMLCKNQTWIPSSGAGVNDLTVRLPQKKKKKKRCCSLRLVCLALQTRKQHSSFMCVE